MGGHPGAGDRARAGLRRSRQRRDLLPALAGGAGTADRRKRRRDDGDLAPNARGLGPRRGPHAAWRADRAQARGFSELTRRVRDPSFCAQPASRTFAATITPIVTRAALAEV